jgi:hypothetical protein
MFWIFERRGFEFGVNDDKVGEYAVKSFMLQTL